MARGDRGPGRRSARGGMSLATSFTLAAVLIVLLFGALLGYFGFVQVGREKERVQEDAVTQARVLAAQIETLLTARLDAAGGAAEALAAGASPDQLLRRLRQNVPELAQGVIVDGVGGVLAATPGEARRGLGDQPWFRKAATSTQAFVGEIRQTDQEILVGLYAPSRTGEGQLRGVVAADVSLRRLQALLESARLPGGAVAEVVADTGLVVARRPRLFLMQDVKRLPGYAAVLGAEERTGELTFADGERRLMGSAAVRPVGWVVVVGRSSAQVLAETRNLLLQLGGGAAVVALLALALASSLTRRATRGMNQLRSAMSRLERGDIPANLQVTTGGEVGALAESFNRMIGWLRNKLREYEMLSQVSEAAGAALGPDRPVADALPGLLRRVVGAMGADAGALLIQEDKGLVTKAGVGFAGVAAEGVIIRRGQGLAGAVVGTGETVVVADVDADYRIEEPYLKTGDVRSVVAVPIVVADRAVGAMEIVYRTAHTFTDGDLHRLVTMARRAAQAIEHTRALEEVRRNTSGLEAKLAEQMEALQKAAAERTEMQKREQEARRKAQELEQTIRMQVSQASQVSRADPAAEEAKRIRVALQKTVSEELRVPLTALLDLPRFLVEGLDKPLSDEERQQLEILHNRGEEIIELIDNLAILSGLHAGHVKIAKAPVNLADLVQRVVRHLQPRAAAKGNRIEVDIKAGVGQVVTDARRVEQVLTNLLVNAIKYTEVGEIRVTCYVRDANFVITVADDGAGFSPEEQERVFEPFLPIGPRDGRTVPGTGLSLSVCHRLVELLGGKIRVESEVDRGSWFTVTVPARA